MSSNYNPGQELSSLDFANMIGGPLNAMVRAQAQAAMSTVEFIQNAGFDEDNKPIYVSFTYPKLVAPFQQGNISQVVSITVTDGGGGYTSAPKVEIDDDSKAKAVAFLDGTDSVQRIEISNSGYGYDQATPPTVTIEAAPSGGTNATATAAVGEEKGIPAIYQDHEISVPLLGLINIPSIVLKFGKIDFNAKINSIETREIKTNLGINGSLEVKQAWGSGSAKLNVSASYRKSSRQGFKIEKTFSLGVQVEVENEPAEGFEKLLDIMEEAIISRPLATESQS